MNRHKRRMNMEHEVCLKNLENVQKVVGDLIVDTEDDSVRDRLIDVMSTVRLRIRSLNYELSR